MSRGVTPRSAKSAKRTGGASGGRIFPNLLFLYRKTLNISRNLAFGRRENVVVQKASGGAKMALRGGKNYGSTKASGGAKSL